MSEPLILYDLSKDFEVMKDQSLFHHNILLDSNNTIYVALVDKIYVLSIRKIALSKCALKDIIDFQKLIVSKKEVQHHFVDEITNMYSQNPSDSQQQALASFILKEDAVNLVKDSLLRQRLVTVNNDPLSLAIKSIKISQTCLLQNNHPFLTVLLSNGDAYNIGFFQSQNALVSSYKIIDCLNEVLTSAKNSSIEVMSFDWNKQYEGDLINLQILVVHTSDGRLSLIGYDSTNRMSKIIGSVDIQESKSKQVTILNVAQSQKIIELKVIVTTGKNICTVHLEVQMDNQQLQQVNPIHKAPISFIDRVFVLEHSSRQDLIFLSRNQDLFQFDINTNSITSQISTFSGNLGKIVGLFIDSCTNQLTVFNEKSQIEIIPFEELTKKKPENNKLSTQVTSFCNSLYLPFGVAQSFNTFFYIVIGAHSFTSQQITNLLLLNHPSNIIKPPIQQLARCFKNFEKYVIKDTKLPSKKEEDASYHSTIPLNFDDLLFELLKNPNDFLDLLKLSLLIQDKTKAIKKFNLSKQFIEELEEYLSNLQVNKDKLKFLNEKLLLFLTSMQKESFSDFLSQLKLQIVTRNYQRAISQLSLTHSNSSIFKRMKVLRQEQAIQRFSETLNLDESMLEEVICSVTLLSVVEEPLLQCKNCKHFCIDIQKYLQSQPLQQDNSNDKIKISQIFSLTNNICPLCSGLLKPLIQ